MFGGFPFNMPGAGPNPGPRERPNVNNTRYYEILGVNKDATPEELKRAHRKLALRLHPDKGGDPDKFKEINEAYDVLRDEEKRKIYDQFGEEGIKEGVSGGGGPMDIFDLFMGGGRGGGKPRERRSEDVVHKLQVSLEDVYVGTTKKLALARKLPCHTCRGAGTKSGKRYECKNCGGSGVSVQIRQLGPGMIQQVQGRCTACEGTGYATPLYDRCTACQGTCLVSEKKTFEVQVEPGMAQGKRIVLRGEAGCSEPGLAAGDIVLVVAVREHQVFKRVHCDLIMEREISLTEALCGFTFTFEHLDGRVLRVSSPPGEVVKPGTFKRIAEEGMPIHGRPYSKGNLYIHFTIKFPERLNPDQVQGLSIVMPLSREAAAATAAAAALDAREDDVEDVRSFVTVPDIEEELKARAHMGRGAAEAYDDSDEEGLPRGQRMQCAQQ